MQQQVNRVLLSVLPILILAGYAAGEEVLPTPQPHEEPDEQDLATESRWKRWGMVYQCNGYLSRDQSKDFCEEDVPSDWIPFEYEGETYYIAPLGAGEREQG